MACAVAMYEDERAKPVEVKKLSLRAVCEAVQKEYFKSDGVMVSLNHNTLWNLVNGGRTLLEMNASKSWLTKQEADEVIKFTVEIAAWGHGLDHR